jgi:hypothetical protein
MNPLKKIISYNPFNIPASGHFTPLSCRPLLFHQKQFIKWKKDPLI